MTYLERYYDARAANLAEHDFLNQVGHTEGGTSITPAQFQNMLGQLNELLALRPDDTFLDLCCGNGLITAELAKNVKFATGIELSENMVTIAQKHHGAPHIRYIKQDIFRLPDIAELEAVSYSKILMQGALQHFKATEFEHLLETILSKAAPDCTIVFGFVPQNGKQKYFFNTLKRKFSSMIYRLLGKDIFGTWWDEKYVTKICKIYGLECAFSTVDPSLIASAYRCNIKVWRQQEPHA